MNTLSFICLKNAFMTLSCQLEPVAGAVSEPLWLGRETESEMEIWDVLSVARCALPLEASTGAMFWVEVLRVGNDMGKDGIDVGNEY